MTEERLVLAELLEKAGEGDFLRSVAEAVLQLLMENDVEGVIGAGRYERSGERTTWRNRLCADQRREWQRYKPWANRQPIGNGPDQLLIGVDPWAGELVPCRRSARTWAASRPRRLCARPSSSAASARTITSVSSRKFTSSPPSKRRAGPRQDTPTCSRRSMTAAGR